MSTLCKLQPKPWCYGRPEKFTDKVISSADQLNVPSPYQMYCHFGHYLEL